MFAFVIPWGKFVYQHKGRWNTEEAVSKESIRELLLNEGFDSKAVTDLFAVGNYPKVFGAGMYPGREEFFAFPADPKRFYLNTWHPPTLRAESGRPYPRVHVVLDWLTGNDAEGKRWLIHWMARKVQNPELLPKVGVVLLGAQGSGKGTLGWLMRQMLGPANCAVIERAALESQFNSSWLGKLFVQADEIVSPEHMKSLGERLKMLITSDELEMEAKGRDRTKIQNRTAWLFCSNDRVSPIILEAGDRRYSVFANHDDLTPDYDALIRGCFNPDDTPTPSFLAEVQGFYADCLALEVDKAFVCRPYDNPHREQLIQGSERGHEAFIREIKAGGVDTLFAEVEDVGYNLLPHPRSNWDFGERGVSTRVLYQVYAHYCKQRGFRELSLARFGTALTAQGWRQQQNRVPGNHNLRPRCYVLPRTPPDETAAGPQLPAKGLASGNEKC